MTKFSDKVSNWCPIRYWKFGGYILRSSQVIANIREGGQNLPPPSGARVNRASLLPPVLNLGYSSINLSTDSYSHSPRLSNTTPNTRATSDPSRFRLHPPAVQRVIREVAGYSAFYIVSARLIRHTSSSLIPNHILRNLNTPRLPPLNRPSHFIRWSPLTYKMIRYRAYGATWLPCGCIDANRLPAIAPVLRDGLNTRRPINTRTGGGSENHTVWRGGAYNAPPIDLSSYES